MRVLRSKKLRSVLSIPTNIIAEIKKSYDIIKVLLIFYIYNGKRK